MEMKYEMVESVDSAYVIMTQQQIFSQTYPISVCLVKQVCCFCLYRVVVGGDEPVTELLLQRGTTSSQKHIKV